MTATNHAITGAIIGALAPIWVTVPIAFLSHIILDAMPHYDDPAMLKRSKKFKAILIADIIGCFIVAVLLITIQPNHWLNMLVCAFTATSPDFLWIPDYLASIQHKKQPNYGPLRRFFARIQWSQTKNGKYVELVWFLGTSILLHQLIVA